MGYTISIRLTGKLRRKMIQFMREHYRTWDEVSGQDGPWRGRFAVNPHNLSYDGHRSAIGFDYGPTGRGEHLYIWSVCKWLARKAGHKHIIYDGSEKVPFVSLVERERNTADHYRKALKLAPVGIRFIHMLFGNQMLKHLTIEEKEYSREVELVKKELKRLDSLWRKYEK